MSKEPTAQQVDSVCLSYRHDFGLLDEDDKNKLRFQAKEWLIAWQKEGLDLPVKPWAFLEEGKEFRASFDDLFPGSRITCDLEWEHDDGNRVVRMVKKHFIPCFITVGMEIFTEFSGTHEIRAERTFLTLDDYCVQVVYLTEMSHGSAEELDDAVKYLQDDGWTLASETVFIWDEE